MRALQWEDDILPGAAAGGGRMEGNLTAVPSYFFWELLATKSILFVYPRNEKVISTISGLVQTLLLAVMKMKA